MGFGSNPLKKRLNRRSNKGGATVSFAIEFEIPPIEEMLKKLNALETINVNEEMEKRILPKVLQPLVNAANAASPVDLGNLQNSFASKIVRYDKDKVVVGIVGVDSKFFNTGKPRKRRKAVEEKKAKKSSRKSGIKKGDILREASAIGEYYTPKIRPSKYFQLVELGHALKGKKGTHPATHFFKNAIEANKGQAGEIFVAELQDLYERAQKQ